MSPTWISQEQDHLWTIYNYTCLLRSPRKKSSLFFISNGWEGSQSMTTLTYQMTQLRETEFLSVSFSRVLWSQKSEDLCRKIGVPKCWDFASRNHRTFWWRDSPQLYRYWPVLLNPSSFCGAYHLNTLHSNQRWHRKKTLKEVDCNLSRSIFNQSNLIPMGPPFSNQPAPLAGWTRTHPCIAQSWSCAHCSWASRFPTHCSYAVAGAPGETWTLVPNPKVLKGVYPGLGSYCTTAVAAMLLIFCCVLKCGWWNGWWIFKVKFVYQKHLKNSLSQIRRQIVQRMCWVRSFGVDCDPKSRNSWSSDPKSGCGASVYCRKA